MTLTVPSAPTSSPLPPTLGPPPLLKVVSVTVRLSVPLASLMSALSKAEPVMVELVIDTLPVRPTGELAPWSSKFRPSSKAPVPLPETVDPSRVSPFT